MRSRLQHRNLKSKVHPGWLAPARTASEILALKLSVSHGDLIARMERDVRDIVEIVFAHRQERSKSSFFRSQDEFLRLKVQKETEKAAVAAEVSSTANARKKGLEHVFLGAAERSGGFRQFQSWYVTDDWNDDAWLELTVDVGFEDARLRHWTIQLGSSTPDYGVFCLDPPDEVFDQFDDDDEWISTRLD